jgi:hypothetical protein
MRNSITYNVTVSLGKFKKVAKNSTPLITALGEPIEEKNESMGNISLSCSVNG